MFLVIQGKSFVALGSKVIITVFQENYNEISLHTEWPRLKSTNNKYWRGCRQKGIFTSSLSAISVVSSAYLRLLIFLPAIFIPACASSSPGFHMMYSAYKLNKQGDNIQP